MKIGILGAGAYGMALASVLNKNHWEIEVWTPLQKEFDYLTKYKTVEKLPNYQIPEEIKFSMDIEEVCKDKELLVIAIPTEYLDSVAKQMAPFIQEQHICIATKGIENHTCRFCDDIIKSYIQTEHIAVISGPTFAVDMINEVTMGLTLGTKNLTTKLIVKKAFQNNFLKIRTTMDIKGVEFCGAIKNVIAIAAGMLDGMNLPESTKAMFVTEALHDVKDLIEEFGGEKGTILAFAGFGDLLLTCTSPKSRNFSFGKMIGEQKNPQEINQYKEQTTIEGLYTLDSIYLYSKKREILMPFIDLIYDIIYKNEKPETLLTFLIQK